MARRRPADGIGLIFRSLLPTRRLLPAPPVAAPSQQRVGCILWWCGQGGAGHHGPVPAARPAQRQGPGAAMAVRDGAGFLPQVPGRPARSDRTDLSIGSPFPPLPLFLCVSGGRSGDSCLEDDPPRDAGGDLRGGAGLPALLRRAPSAKGRREEPCRDAVQHALPHQRHHLPLRRPGDARIFQPQVGYCLLRARRCQRLGVARPDPRPHPCAKRCRPHPTG